VVFVLSVVNVVVVVNVTIVTGPGYTFTTFKTTTTPI